MEAKQAGVKMARIPGDVLYESSLSVGEKMLVGLAWTFKDGLKLSNNELSRIIGIHPTNVSKLIAKLQAVGWLRVINQQSRWRKIYFGDVAKVKRADTLVENGDTLVRTPIYFGDVTKQKVKRKYKKGKPEKLPEEKTCTSSPSLKAQSPVNIEQQRRVFGMLGFDTNSDSTHESEAV